MNKHLKKVKCLGRIRQKNSKHTTTNLLMFKPLEANKKNLFV